MEITKEALIAGETILVDKINIANKRLYLGNSGLIYFVSRENDFKQASGAIFTIGSLQKHFNIEEPKSKVVPLELKIYDFIPVRYRDSEIDDWSNGKLVFVNPKNPFPFCILTKCESTVIYKYCEFI